MTENRAGARHVARRAAAVAVACACQGAVFVVVTASPAAADAPSVEIVSPGPARAGQVTVVSDPATVTASYEAADATAQNCEFEWGDGTSSTATPADGRCRGTHDYPGDNDAASRSVVVRVTFDQAGNTVEATDTVEMAVHPYFFARLVTPHDGALVADAVAVHLDMQGTFLRPVSTGVDWGDDEQSTCDGQSCTHRYAAPGTYEVTAHAEWELLGTRLRWSDLVAVRVAPPPTATWGVVRMPGGVTTNFAVRQGEAGIDGALWVRRGRSEFRSEEVTGLRGGLGNAVIEATGTWRGEPGHTLELSLLDFDGGDQATVTIRDADDHVVVNAGGGAVEAGGVEVVG